ELLRVPIKSEPTTPGSQPGAIPFDRRSLDAFKRRVVSRALQLMPRPVATEYPSTAIERATREFLRSPSPQAGESRLESGAEGLWKLGRRTRNEKPFFLENRSAAIWQLSKLPSAWHQ